MRDYIYKVIIFSIAIIIIFKFTIGDQISRVTDKLEIFTSADGRKQVVESLKKEIRKANERENYLDDDERELLRNFILKIKRELALDEK
jgi:hypothetical protein|tara:strand:+ start:426 stop:692 length:267 start_codon:yes stop_codon:yes gene_type:complete